MDLNNPDNAEYYFLKKTFSKEMDETDLKEKVWSVCVVHTAEAKGERMLKELHLLFFKNIYMNITTIIISIFLAVSVSLDFKSILYFTVNILMKHIQFLKAKIQRTGYFPWILY